MKEELNKEEIEKLKTFKEKVQNLENYFDQYEIQSAEFNLSKKLNESDDNVE
jgi:hypothetical protein